MQLTAYTDYSLRVLIYLGLHPDRLATISEIADAYRISRNHLLKVVHHLGQIGAIQTFRGKSGGIRLATEPEHLNIGAIVRQTEPHLDLLECFNIAKDTCPITPACALKSILDQAKRSFLAVLDQYTLADVLKNRERLSELMAINQ